MAESSGLETYSYVHRKDLEKVQSSLEFGETTQLQIFARETGMANLRDGGD
jgi:hypothetical protein